MLVNCHLLSANQLLIFLSLRFRNPIYSSASAPITSIYNQKPNKSSSKRVLLIKEFFNEIAFPVKKDPPAPLEAFKLCLFSSKQLKDAKENQKNLSQKIMKNSLLRPERCQASNSLSQDMKNNQRPSLLNFVWALTSEKIKKKRKMIQNNVENYLRHLKFQISVRFISGNPSSLSLS